MKKQILTIIMANTLFCLLNFNLKAQVIDDLCFGNLQNTGPGYLSCFGDFNGDGHIDLVNYGEPYLGNKFLRFTSNTGSGTFSVSATTIQLPSYMTASGNEFLLKIMTIDVNSDSKLDFITIGQDLSNSLILSTYIGNGDGTFVTPTNFTLPSYVSNYNLQICSSDFNNDLKIDLAICSDKRLLILNGNGINNFTLISNTLYTWTYSCTQMRVDKINGDNNFDLVVHIGSGFSIFLGIGNNSFTQIGGIANNVSASKFFIADYNNDNLKDIAYIGNAPANASTEGLDLGFLYGQGNGNFSIAQTFTFSPGLYISITDGVIADFNLDGKQDFIVTGIASNYKDVAYISNTNGYNIGVLPSLLNAEKMYTYDFNSDTRPDIAWQGGGVSGSSEVSFNLALPSFTTDIPNTICTNTSQLFTVSGNASNYTWNGASGSSIFFNSANIQKDTIIKVIGTNSQGCNKTIIDTLQIIDCTATAINEFSAYQYNILVIYPNPTSGQLNISGLDINQKQIFITNIIGENIRTIETKGNTAISVDVENLSPGVYFINSNNKSVKFIKE